MYKIKRVLTDKTKLQMLKKNQFLAIFFIILFFSCSNGNTVSNIGLPIKSFLPKITADGWDISSLESQNINLNQIAQVDDLLKNNPIYSDINTLTIVRHGKLVFDEFYYKGVENYKKGDITTLMSVTKSFMSIVTGIVIDKGLIQDINNKVELLLPNSNSIVWSGKKTQITLENILTMSAGFNGSEETDSLIVNNYAKYMFSKPLIYTPGSTFDYRTALTNTLRDILSQSISNQNIDLRAFIKNNLFQPMQISNYKWDYINHFGQLQVGGGLFLAPRDMIKLGQLVLNKGKWQNTQIVSANWIAEATKKHFNFTNKYWGEMDGYGYLFWQKELTSFGQTYQSIIAIGYGGQYLVIIPSLDVVIGITSWFPNDVNWQLPLRLIENYIIPAVNP